MEPTMYTDSAALGIFGTVYILFIVVLALVFVAALWKIFTKAGRPGWASLVPFYNSYTLFGVAGMSGWWFLALFVPILNLVALILLSINLAHVFGKSTAFGIIALWLFSAVGILILAFGNASYLGVQAQTSTPPVQPEPVTTTPEAVA